MPPLTSSKNGQQLNHGPPEMRIGKLFPTVSPFLYKHHHQRPDVLSQDYHAEFEPTSAKRSIPTAKPLRSPARCLAISVRSSARERRRSFLGSTYSTPNLRALRKRVAISVSSCADWSFRETKANQSFKEFSGGGFGEQKVHVNVGCIGLSTCSCASSPPTSNMYNRTEGPHSKSAPTLK